MNINPEWEKLKDVPYLAPLCCIPGQYDCINVGPAPKFHMKILDKCKKLYQHEQYKVFQNCDPNVYFSKRCWLMSCETFAVLYAEISELYLLKWDSYSTQKSLFGIPIRFDQTVVNYSVQLAFILECCEE